MYEIRFKIVLWPCSERDHKAYYESSQYDRRQNEEEITALRNGSKEKRITLAQKTFEVRKTQLRPALITFK